VAFPKQPIGLAVVSEAASVNRKYPGCLDRFSRAFRSASVPVGDRAGRIGRPQTNSLYALQGLERSPIFGKHHTVRSCELNPALVAQAFDPLLEAKPDKLWTESTFRIVICYGGKLASLCVSDKRSCCLVSRSIHAAMVATPVAA
jgi:hypothetical protein